MNEYNRAKEDQKSLAMFLSALVACIFIISVASCTVHDTQDRAKVRVACIEEGKEFSSGNCVPTTSSELKELIKEAIEK